MYHAISIIPAIGWRAVYAEDGLISRPVVAWCLAGNDTEGEDGFDYSVVGQTCNKGFVGYEHAVNFLGYMHESEDVEAMYREDYNEYMREGDKKSMEKIKGIPGWDSISKSDIERMKNNDINM
jgi:hypothetical protein